MPRKKQNLSRSSARKQPESVWEQPEISQNLFGNSQKRARTCLGESTICLELVWERPENAVQMAWTKAEMTRIGLARKGKTGERRAARARYRRKGGGFRVFTLYIALPRTRGPGLALMRTCSRLWCCVRASTIFRGRHEAQDGAGRKSSEVRLGRRRCRAAALRPQFRV